MESQFELELGTCLNAQETFETLPSADPNPPARVWQFVSDFQQLVGGDSEPDPLFFVESWTLGASVAAENFRQRKLKQSDLAARASMFRQFANFGSQFFIQESTGPVEQPRATRCKSHSYAAPAAQSQASPEPEWESFAEEFATKYDNSQPMTQNDACQLLGVSAKSTRVQLKAAYRRMVTEWHPDRLENRTENVRQVATEKMSAINEAYRILRNLLQKTV